ncbi:hypothetical protein FOYG_17403 [Fusarium oxysporum NRRL 32931]|uniref:Uncharacterized protein n=1 Tax=Fusarium oxysporum NRRL 32931 TaxID=660029 RepID=W9HER6_FUSOX|nr:hypothetical protein FOYG_17403 [Fusarium oxysporum NRRL 32931]
MAPTTRMRKLPGDAPRAKAMEGNLIAERTIQSKSRRKRRTDGATVKKVQARLQNHENKVTIDLTVGSACDNQSTENSPRGDRRVSTIKSENTGWHNTQSNGNRTVASDLVQDGAELLGVSQPQPLVPTIDLTDDLNDDESHENSRLTAGIKSEPLNTEATDIIATTNDRGTRPFATEELMVENESEQETSAIELGPQSASCEAVIAAAGDHAEASTISLTPAPNPTSDIGLQEGPIGKAHLGEGLADIGQGTPEEVQRHLKNSLQLVQKSIKTLETELKAMDEKRKSLRQRLDERKQDAQHLTACINKSETEAKKLEKRRNKRKGAVDRHMLKTKRQRPSVPVDKTDPPACVQEPTAAASTTVTSPTTHIVLQPPGVGYHGASAHESRPLETGPDTLRGVIHDTVNPAIQSQSADVEEVENQILINSNDSQLPHGTPGLIGSRTTWEEVKQSNL